MKRKLLLYGLLILILVGGIPYITGMIAEQRFQELTHSLSSLDHLQITTLEYERGWLKSKAKSRIVMSGSLLTTFLQEVGQEAGANETRSEQPIKVVLVHSLKHGPFIQKAKGNHKDWLFAQAQIHSSLSLTEEAKAVLEQEIGDKDFLLFNTVLTMGSDITIDLDGKPIQVLQDDTQETIWQGIQAKWNITEDLHSIQGHIAMPGFYFEKNQAIYQAENIVVKLDGNLNKTDIHSAWQVHDKYEIGRLTVLNKNKPTLSLHGVLVNKQPKADFVDLQVQNLEIADKTFGSFEAKVTFSPSTTKGQLRAKKELLKAIYDYQLSDTLDLQTFSGITDEKISEKVLQQRVLQKGDFYITDFEWAKGGLRLP